MSVRLGPSQSAVPVGWRGGGGLLPFAAGGLLGGALVAGAARPYGYYGPPVVYMQQPQVVYAQAPAGAAPLSSWRVMHDARGMQYYQDPLTGRASYTWPPT